MNRRAPALIMAAAVTLLIGAYLLMAREQPTDGARESTTTQGSRAGRNDRARGAAGEDEAAAGNQGESSAQGAEGEAPRAGKTPLLLRPAGARKPADDDAEREAPTPVEAPSGTPQRM